MLREAEGTWTPGTRLRLARQARGLSQQQLAGVAGVTRQAVSAVESGHSDPSLRVALGIARALGMTIEELFGRGEAADPVRARLVAPDAGPGSRVVLATVGDRFVALPLRGDTVSHGGFSPAGGLVSGPARDPVSGLVSGPVSGPGGGRVPGLARDRASGPAGDAGLDAITVHPIGPPRPTLVVAGCDPALPLLQTPLALLDPPVAFAWWPCGSGEALRLAEAGLVHAAGVHSAGHDVDADVVGFASWREGLVVRPGTPVRDLTDIARLGLRLVNRELGAQARTVLDEERERLHLDPADLPGYDSQAAGHLQVAAAVAGRIADAGVSSEPAALAYGLDFLPLATERFDLVLPSSLVASREVQGLLKVLTSPWLLAQLASLPSYDPSSCGERISSLTPRPVAPCASPAPAVQARTRNFTFLRKKTLLTAGFSSTKR
jgi:putative molybdopterin biosynthesis protein